MKFKIGQRVKYLLVAQNFRLGNFTATGVIVDLDPPDYYQVALNGHVLRLNEAVLSAIDIAGTEWTQEKI
jgi:hypothetical protein